MNIISNLTKKLWRKEKSSAKKCILASKVKYCFAIKCAFNYPFNVLDTGGKTWKNWVGISICHSYQYLVSIYKTNLRIMWKSTIGNGYWMTSRIIQRKCKRIKSNICFWAQNYQNFDQLNYMLLNPECECYPYNNRK